GVPRPARPRRDRHHAVRRPGALCAAADHRLVRCRSGELLLGGGGGRNHARLDHHDRRGDRRRRAGAFSPRRAGASAAAESTAPGRNRHAGFDRPVRPAGRLSGHETGDPEQHADLAGAGVQPRLALRPRGDRRRADGALLRAEDPGPGIMILAATVLVFVILLLLSVPIVFCLGAAAVVGLLLGGYPLQQLGSSMIAASQSWVLLAIPSFIFAGSLMERAGMSNSLVELARALVGWVRGGLGMSVIVVSYFFSDICGSKIDEGAGLGSPLVPA